VRTRWRLRAIDGSVRVFASRRSSLIAGGWVGVPAAVSASRGIRGGPGTRVAHRSRSKTFPTSRGNAALFARGKSALGAKARDLSAVDRPVGRFPACTDRPTDLGL